MNLVDKYIAEIRDEIALTDFEVGILKTKMISMAREYADRRISLLKEDQK